MVEASQVLWNNVSSLPKCLGIVSKDVQRQRHNLMSSFLCTFPRTLNDNVSGGFIQGLKEPEARVRLCVALDCLRPYVDLLRVNPDLMTPGGCKWSRCSI